MTKWSNKPLDQLPHIKGKYTWNIQWGDHGRQRSDTEFDPKHFKPSVNVARGQISLSRQLETLSMLNKTSVVSRR